MENKIIIDVMKEFSNSNINKLKIKYKKFEIELEKDNNTEDNDVLIIKDTKEENTKKDEKWIMSPIVRKVLQVRNKRRRYSK